MSEMITRVHLDANGQDLAIEHIQDVAPILENNKHLRAQEQRGDWGRHIAEIPNVIYVRWLDEEHARGNISLRMFTPEFDAIVARKLQDPDWAYLRVDRPPLVVSGWGQTFHGYSGATQRGDCHDKLSKSVLCRETVEQHNTLHLSPCGRGRRLSVSEAFG